MQSKSTPPKGTSIKSQPQTHSFLSFLQQPESLQKKKPIPFSKIQGLKSNCGESRILFKMESEAQFRAFQFQGQAISLKEVCTEVLIKIKKLPSNLFNLTESFSDLSKDKAYVDKLIIYDQTNNKILYQNWQMQHVFE